MFERPLHRDGLLWVAAAVPLAVLLMAQRRERAWGSGWYEAQEWAVELAVVVPLALVGVAWSRRRLRSAGRVPTVARLACGLGIVAGGFLYDPYVFYAGGRGPAQLPLWSWTGALGGSLVGLVVGVMLARATSSAGRQQRSWFVGAMAVLSVGVALWAATLPVQATREIQPHITSTFACGDTYQVAVDWNRAGRSGPDWALCNEAGQVRVLGMAGLLAGASAAGLIVLAGARSRRRRDEGPASLTSTDIAHR